MMATAFCTALAAAIGTGCLSVRLAADRYSQRSLPWSVSAIVFLAFGGCGAWELLP